jgi:pimeloyl-ACP methyl ester carboxylesterase
VSDLESVVEALELQRFPLLGVSQGGAVAVAYAARHPERVNKLVLCSSYARGRGARAVNEDEKRAAALDLDLARVGWGRDDPAFRQVFAAQFQPDGTRADWAAFDQLQRRTTSPENAVRFLEEFGRIDVSEEAAAVSCPTLILHSRDDHRQPLRAAEELAALIPDSRLVALTSNNHLLTAAEPAWQVFLDEVESFLAD